MGLAKTEMVSVRVEPHIKQALQTASEREMRSLANMVEVMVVTYCRSHSYPLPGISTEALVSAMPGDARHDHSLAPAKKRAARSKG